VGFDSGDGQVVVAVDCGEKAPDSLNKGLVAGRLDGVFPKESYAVLTVGKEVNAPPGHSRGGPVYVSNPLESVVKCADLPVLFVGRGAPIQSESVQSVITGPHREAEESWGLEMNTPHPAEAGSREAEPSMYMTMSGLEKGVWPRVIG